MGQIEERGHAESFGLIEFRAERFEQYFNCSPIIIGQVGPQGSGNVPSARHQLESLIPIEGIPDKGIRVEFGKYRSDHPGDLAGYIYTKLVFEGFSHTG